MDDTTRERLQAVVDAGGTLEELSMRYSDLAGRGLVTIDPIDGGWGFTEEIALTTEGKRFLGLPVVGLPVRQPWWSRVLRLVP